MMRTMLVTIMICSAFALGGCDRQPRSEDYFHAHLGDARRVVARCRAGTTRGEECGNADYAVRLAHAEAMRDRFFKIDQ